MRKIIGYICMVMASGSLVSPIMADGHPPPKGMMPEDGMMHHPDGMVPKDGMMHGPNGMMMHEEGMPMMMGERPPECDAAEAVIMEAGIDPGAFASDFGCCGQEGQGRFWTVAWWRRAAYG